MARTAVLQRFRGSCHRKCIGELCDDHQQAIDVAILAGHLVLIETHRAAVSYGEPIKMVWEEREGWRNFLLAFDGCAQGRGRFVIHVARRGW